MLHTGGVDETLFVQILHAYSARNPLELILDDAYDACLATLSGQTEQNTQNGTELQLRFGAKLFVRERENGESMLVAGTKKRNLELIPLRRVFVTLQELAQEYFQSATQLKQAVKGKVLGIPEEIVQEYCDMAVSSFPTDEGHPGRDEEFKKCMVCGVMKSFKSFARHRDKSMGHRSRCKACELKGKVLDRKESDRNEECTAVSRRKKKKEAYMEKMGTAICAACGDRKPVFDFDKARQKPFTLKCRSCTETNAPLMRKFCCSCNQELPLDHFYRDSYTKAGFRPKCMECMKERKTFQPKSEDPSVTEDDLMEEPPESISKRSRSKRQRKIPQRDESFKEDTAGVLSLSKSFSKKRTTRRQRCNIPSKVEGNSTQTLDAFENGSLDASQRSANESFLEDVKKGRAKPLTGCTTVKDHEGNVTKYCTGCLIFKKACEFGRDVSKPSGLRSRCRQCHKRSRDVTATVEDVPIVAAQKKIPRKPARKKPVTFLKVCSRCDQEKSVNEFYRDKSKEDSLASICKKCAKQAKKTSEKTFERAKSSAFERLKPGSAQNIEDTDMEIVLNYVDAMLPESSECSAGLGDEEDVEEVHSVAQHRICIQCKIDKNWIEFDLNPLLPDGLCPLCKNCRRGNGMRGRRLKKVTSKRCCVRCGRSKSPIQFAKSIFFPNRVSRVCERCRKEDQLPLNMSTSKRKRCRVEKNHNEALDLIDFECDVLRVADPGGGERLWQKYDSEIDDSPKKDLTRSLFRSLIPTELKSDAPNCVTITHRIPAGSDTLCTHRFQPTPSVGCSLNGFHFKKSNHAFVAQKQCKKCGEMKNRDDFYLDEDQFSQLSPNCIECSVELQTK